jgi:hypothetical protein
MMSLGFEYVGLLGGLMIGSCFAPIIGFVMGMAIGYRWRRSVICGTFGATAALVGWWFEIYRLWLATNEWTRTRKLSQLWPPAPTLAVLVTVGVALITLWLNGDGRPKPAPADVWHAPGPNEVGTALGTSVNPTERPSS